MAGFAQLFRSSVLTEMDAPPDDREAHVQVHSPLRPHLISSCPPMFVFHLFPFEVHPVWEELGRLALLAQSTVGLWVTFAAIHGTVVGADCGPVQGRPAIDRGRGRGGWISVRWTLAGAIWMLLAVGCHWLGV
jgi:hypothetical protein